MKLKKNRLKQYSHRQAIPGKDSEGNSYVEYGPPSPFFAEVWPAGGKLQAELYGQRISSIRNCRIDGAYVIQTDAKGRVSYQIPGTVIREGDGVCLNVSGKSEPDYRILAIRPYRFLTLEVEKI